MRRVVSAREQAEMLSPWLKTADDELMTSPTATAIPANPTAAPTAYQPPTLTSIPRDQFDNVLASKGVTYDQHLDNLESHFNAASEEQKKRGRVWYRAGGDTLRDIATKFGISTNRAIAMAAALSSRTDWNNNLHYAAHMAGNYRPGENEDEWQRSAIHPSALAKYMEDRHGIVPDEKSPDDPTNPAHFSHKELEGLKQNGFMPRTKDDFNQLANAHAGDHWQYTPAKKKNNVVVKPGQWDNKPLRGFEELQTPEGRSAWLANAKIPKRGGIDQNRQSYEDVVDAHMRYVRDSKSPYGYQPNTSYEAAGLPTLGNNVNKAKLLMQVGEQDFDKHLNGQKYRAFFSNLGNQLRFHKADWLEDQGHYDLGGKHWSELDPELLRSTVDTQHMRAASQPHGSDEPAPNYTESSQVSPEQYEVYQQGLIDLTHRINSKLPAHRHLLPHQVQAIIWGKFKDSMKDKKNSAGQSFFSPTMDDIQPFGDRYSSLRVANHIHPSLLEPPLSDPFHTDSGKWFDAVMDSWTDRHQHELSAAGPRDQQFLAWVDKLLGEH